MQVFSDSVCNAHPPISISDSHKYERLIIHSINYFLSIK